VSDHRLDGPAKPEARTTGARCGGSAIAIAAFTWTVLIGALLLIVPVGSSATETVLSDGTVVEVTSRETLLDGEGPQIVLLLVVPVALTGAAVAASLLKRAREVRFITGAALLAACMLAAASIGTFYAPAAIG
jgi:hypothetical protein